MIAEGSYWGNSLNTQDLVIFKINSKGDMVWAFVIGGRNTEGFGDSHSKKFELHQADKLIIKDGKLGSGDNKNVYPFGMNEK